MTSKMDFRSDSVRPRILSDMIHIRQILHYVPLLLLYNRFEARNDVVMTQLLLRDRWRFRAIADRTLFLDIYVSRSTVWSLRSCQLRQEVSSDCSQLLYSFTSTPRNQSRTVRPSRPRQLRQEFSSDCSRYFIPWHSRPEIDCPDDLCVLVNCSKPRV